MSASRAPRPPAGNRRKSRELVLKGLYQLLLGAGDIQEIAQGLREDEDHAKADQDYLDRLLAAIASQQAALDAALSPLLDRPVAELSPIEHAILWIAGHELLHDVSIPYRVAINEGVELAKRYGGTDGYKYVNGVLDKLALQARPEECKQARPSDRNKQ